MELIKVGRIIITVTKFGGIALIAIWLLCLQFFPKDTQSRMGILQEWMGDIGVSDQWRRSWYDWAADNNNANAQFKLAMLYIEGKGGSKNSERAIELLRQSAAFEHTHAPLCLAYIYEEKNDRRNACSYYQQACAIADAKRVCDIKDIKTNKKVCDSDTLMEDRKPCASLRPTAITITQAASMETIQNTVGRGQTEEKLQEAKRAVKQQDYGKAFKIYTALAHDNHAVAQNDLGFLYQRGLGTEKDYTKALYWYKKAADQDYASAQFNLGWLYAEGMGIEKNLSTARYWYKKAAAQGHEKAKKELKRLDGNS